MVSIHTKSEYRLKILNTFSLDGTPFININILLPLFWHKCIITSSCDQTKVTPSILLRHHKQLWVSLLSAYISSIFTTLTFYTVINMRTSLSELKDIIGFFIPANLVSLFDSSQISQERTYS